MKIQFISRRKSKKEPLGLKGFQIHNAYAVPRIGDDIDMGTGMRGVVENVIWEYQIIGEYDATVIYNQKVNHTRPESKP